MTSKPFLAIALVLCAQALAPDKAAADEGIRLPNYTNPFSETDKSYTGHMVFRCAFDDSAHLDRGTFKPGSLWTSTFAEANGPFTFDAATGRFQSRGDATTMNVVRQGDDQADLVAHVPGDDPLATILRIQAYAKPITFILINRTDVFAGTCVML